MIDQYINFCTLISITYLHSKSSFLRYLTILLSSWNERYQWTLNFFHSKDMSVVCGNLSDESYALSQTSSFQSTLYGQLWRYHEFKRPYARSLWHVSVISVGELGYLCILDRFLCKEWNVMYVFNDIQALQSCSARKEYNVGRLEPRHFRRRCYANSFYFFFF